MIDLKRKIGSANTMWLLVVIVLAVFIVLLMVYMTQSKTTNFTDIADKISAGSWGDILEAGTESSVSADKKIVKWIASGTDDICLNNRENSDQEPQERENKHLFSKYTKRLYIDRIEDKFYNLTWNGEKEMSELVSSKLIENCNKLDYEGLSEVGPNKKYMISLEPMDEKRSAKISFIEIKEDNLLPKAEFRITKIGDKSISPGDDVFDEIEVNKRVEFDARFSTGVDDDIAEYNWKFPDGSTGKGRKENFFFESKGKNVIELQVIDSNGGRNSIKREFYVGYEKEGVIADFSIKPEKVKEGEKTTLKSESSSPQGKITEHKWTFDGETRKGKKIEIQPKKPKNIDITLKVEDYRGNSDSTEKTIIVLPKPKFRYKAILKDKGKWKFFFKEISDLKNLNWEFDGDITGKTEYIGVKELEKTFYDEWGEVNLSGRDVDEEKGNISVKLDKSDFPALNISNIESCKINTDETEPKTELSFDIKNLYKSSDVQKFYMKVSILESQTDNLYCKDDRKKSIYHTGEKVTSSSNAIPDGVVIEPGNENNFFYQTFCSFGSNEDNQIITFKVNATGRAELDGYFNQIFCIRCIDRYKYSSSDPNVNREYISCESTMNFRMENGEPVCDFDDRNIIVGNSTQLMED